MNISVNGHSEVPPGFRFHPTEEELLEYYLKMKVGNQKFEFDVIRDIDLNKLEPWDIQENCRIGSGPQNDWYLFSHKDKKYPTGTRTNRATAAGFWKATGRDKVIYGGGSTTRNNRSTSKRIGMRKTLVFYMGRAPHGNKSDWIMHEYRRLDDINIHNNRKLLGTCYKDDHKRARDNASLTWEELEESSAAADEGWVICRVFKKKNYVKAIDSSTDNIIINRSMYSSKKRSSEATSYMDRMPKCQLDVDDQTDDQLERFIHLPQLKSPTHHKHNLTVPPNSISSSYQPMFFDQMICCPSPADHHDPLASSSSATTTRRNSWVELDQLVAYHLNGQPTDQSSELDKMDIFNTTNTTPQQDSFVEDHSIRYSSSFQELLLCSTSNWSSFPKQTSVPPSSMLDPIDHLSGL